MTRVDFYLLAENRGETRLKFACRLAEKAYSRGNHIFMQTNNTAETKQLDELLWSFRDDSFVPHAQVASEEAPQSAVLIGETPPEDLAQPDLLINLTSRVPTNFGHFKRLAELVPEMDEARREARERYRHYRDRGYEVHHHDQEKSK